MRKLFLFVLLVCGVTGLWAQQEQPFFYHLFADEGLSSDKTTTVVQDHQGFMWIGTEEGLNRVQTFEQFEIFRHDRNDSTSLSDNHITVLYEDSRQRLWAGTRNGLNLYLRESKTFQRIACVHKEGYEYNARINDVVEDEDGDLWIICGKNLLRIDGQSLEEKQLVTLEDESINLVRLGLFESRLRLGTSQGIYTWVDGEFQKSGMAPGLAVTAMVPNKSELWIGTANRGVLRYNAISGETTEFRHDQGKGKLRNDHITGLSLIDESEIWVSTINGVTALDLETETARQFYHDFDNGFSLSDRVIRAVYQDRAGNVWLTTPNSGVNYYHQADNLFGYYGQSEEEGTAKDLMDYGILSIYTEEDQAWLGSRKGISFLEDGQFKHYPLSGQLSQWITGVFSIERSPEGDFWLGTDYRLLNWDPKSQEYRELSFPELNYFKVNALKIRDDHTLWIGTEENGLHVLDLDTRRLMNLGDFSVEPEFEWPAIQSFLELEDQLLVGTRQGIFSVGDGQIQKVPLNKWMEHLSDNLNITVLKADQLGNVLVGTKQDGLLIMDAQLRLLYQVGKKEGMASQDIRAISVSGDRQLWVSTNAGVSRLLRDKKGVGEIDNFDIQDGLQSNHFSERSVGQLTCGKIMMGGLSGLTVFHPDDILDFNIEQNLNLISLSVNGEKMKIGAEGSPLSKDLLVTDKITLTPSQNRFTIEFNALDFTRPTDVVYRYRLKGHNSEWTEQKEATTVTYQNLAGGRSYGFIVQSKGRFSDWSDSKELGIYVQPYYYETIWFKVLVSLFVGFLIGVIVWLRAGQVARKKKELEELVADRSAAIQEEVSMRRETEKKLKEALAEAERASDIKSQFLANMSHEIRTPLNGIMGMTELSLETDLTEEQRTMLDTVHKSTQSLKAIVNDILDIAKIEAGVLKIVNEKYDVRETLDQVMASFQLQAAKKNLALKHWVLPKVPALVLGDAGRLRQILVNLVANAMKFTHSGSITVIVDAMNKRARGLELWFTVTDTGIGIPGYQQENIFKSFMQVESGPSRAYGGTGLGLSISKELVERMGGEIWVESEEGKGSIFSFYIRVEEFNQEGAAVTASVGDASRELAPLTGKVLIVEDIHTNQLVTAKMCEKIGLTPLCVDSGRAALKHLKAEHFNLVLMDLQMPEIDGLGITRLIRSAVIVNQNVPIVAVTASASDEIRERCLAAGMSGFLAKPVALKELYDTLSHVLVTREPDEV